MSDQLTLYTNPMSRGRIARWMLEEVGQPYEAVIVDYRDMHGDEYRAINPMGKVPALRHGDVIVTETAAIIAYLADAFPEAGLAPPPGDPARAAYYRWLFFTAGPIEAALTDRALGVEVPADKRASAGYGSYEAALDTLEGGLSGGGWLAGDRFTGADLYVGAQLLFGLQFDTIGKRPAFETFAARVAGREAYRRAAAIDDALLTAGA